MDDQSEIDQEIKKTELAASLLELRLKEQELLNKPSRGTNALTNPIVLGALITAFITINLTSFTSARQAELEAHKLRFSAEVDRTKFQGQLILDAMRTGDPKTNLQFLIKAGLISDRHDRVWRSFWKNCRPASPRPLRHPQQSQLHSSFRGLAAAQGSAKSSAAWRINRNPLCSKDFDSERV